MNKDDPTSISPRTGVYICGISNMVAGLMATTVVKRFPRLKILISGHLGMTIMHAAVSILAYQKQENAILPLIVMFIFIY